MAFFGLCSQNMSKFRSTLCRQTWRRAHAFAGGKLPGTIPISGAQDGPVSTSQGNTSRLLSSLKTKEAVTNIFSLVDDDMKRIRQHGLKMLRENIVNDELYNIASYFSLSNDALFVMNSAFIFAAKALNYHMFNHGNLTVEQEKVIALVELSMVSYLMHDDITDNTPFRFSMPSANHVWNPYKAKVAGNVMLAIVMSEIAKLCKEATVSFCLAGENMFQGQYMSNMTIFPSGDRFGNYMAVTDLKAGCPGGYWFKALAQIVGASDLLTDVMYRLGYNNGMCLQLVDDFKDFEADLRDGHATATVIFASNEYPILEEMILRRFQEEGDVEKALELVNNTNAKEEAKVLANRYLSQTMILDKLAYSPFRDGLEEVFQYQFQKINY